MGREPEVQPIEEEADPVDAYKHVAVVDCSKAFSNQEVSKLVLKIFITCVSNLQNFYL